MSSRSLDTSRAGARAKAPVRGQDRLSIWQPSREHKQARRVPVTGSPADYDLLRRAGIPCVGLRRVGSRIPVVRDADIEQLVDILVDRTGIVIAQDAPARYDIWSWPYPAARMLLWYGVCVEVADLGVGHGIDAPASTLVEWQSVDFLRECLDAAVPLAEHAVTLFPRQERYEDRVDRLYEITLSIAPLPVAEREALVGDIMAASGRTEGTVRGALLEAVETYEEWRAVQARRRRRRRA